MRWMGALIFVLGVQFVTVKTPVASANTPAEFIESYCTECHLADDPSGERDFESLDLSKTDFDTQWSVQEIIDQLTLGTMPPPDGDQPTTAERIDAIKELTDRLRVMREITSSTGGKTVLRRLSRREYRNTIGDLLAIDMTMFDPTLDFPGDNLSDHFDNVGDTLVTSGHLLERYLNVANRCIEKALAVTEKPVEQTWAFKGKFQPQPELRTAHKEAFDNRYMCLYDHPRSDKDEGAYGYLADLKDGVPVDGIYEVRVRAKAMHRDTPYSQRAVDMDVSEDFRLGIRPGNTAMGDMYHVQPIQPLLAEQGIGDEQFRWYTFRVPLDRGHSPRFTFENGIHDFRGTIGRVYRMHRDLLPKAAQNAEGIFRQRVALLKHGQVPHIRIEEVQVEGPVQFAWPTPSRQRLLGGSEFDPATADETIHNFVSLAFRRHVSRDESERFTAFYRSRADGGREPIIALKETFQAILCSPEFLYFQSPDGESVVQQPPSAQQTFDASEMIDGTLSQDGIAERLSYFLTSSMPDQKLRQLARENRLGRRDVLGNQVRRLLSDERSDAFVADFLDSWLNLRALGTMPPDIGSFRFFYAADLQSDMKNETRRFFRDLIQRNAPVSDWLSARHSFINRDLAKLYRVEDSFSPESPTEFRRYEFDDPRRGGLLGQASVLTVSANGIETSPVVRGVWLLENVMGTPPPPPPDDVPAIEPDTRGSATIRDQLTKHREDEACYQCHRKIDPPGFALECFDAIGQLRGYYDSKRKQRVDTSGVLPDGESFDGLAGFKTQLLRRQEFFVRGFVESLLVHALGRRIEPADRASVDEIMNQAKPSQYATADVILAVVQSDLFKR